MGCETAVAKSNWRTGTAGELQVYPPFQNTPALRWEARTWRVYALALIFPRSVPEYLDDEAVAAELRKCAETERLPWQIPDECLNWSDDHANFRQ
jgi:hypothetical protein